MKRQRMVVRPGNVRIIRWMMVCLVAALLSVALTSSAPKVSAQAGFEGDVTPRPTGKIGPVAPSDVEQIGRFAMGLDTVNEGSEFQRADVAPRTTFGDGRVGMADVVQAIRYAAGIDSLTAAGGPYADLNTPALTGLKDKAHPEAVSEVRIGTPTFGAGTMTVPVELVAMGTENALGFTLAFDPSKLSNPVAVLGTDASSALGLYNLNQVLSGRIGVGIALPAGQKFAAGARQILRVTFNVTAASLGTTTPIGFASSPVQLEIADPNGILIEQRIFTGGTVTINNPTPTLTALNPSSAFAGDVSFTLGVIGTNFVNGSIVRWGSTNLVTTFQSATLLTAAVPASLIATAGTASITVFNPTPGGGSSNALIFSINNPVPSLTGLGFSTIAAGSPAGSLTVTGNGFVPGSVVFWNGRPCPTRFISRTQLIADYAAADIACAGLIRVTVVSPAPGGGTSVVQTFSITPTITAINPSVAFVGGAPFILTVNGTGFCDGARIRVNGTPRSSTIINGNQITTGITAEDLRTATTLQISVISADNQVVSGNVPLRVDDCAPAQPRVTIASTLNFGTAEPARGAIPIADRPSQTFTVQNAGCQPLPLSFTTRRTGADVTSGKIVNTDDSGTFILYNITGGVTQEIRSGSTITIPGTRTWEFRIVFDPKIPTPAGSTSNLAASQIISDLLNSSFTILQGSTVVGSAALTGRVESNSRFINPLAPRLDPLVVFIKSGNDEFSVEASGYDADTNINQVAYQFYDGSGNRVGSPQVYDINLQGLGLLKGQSFSLVKKFTAKDMGLNAQQVQVFFYESDAKQAFATSGLIGTGRGRIVNATSVSAASYAPGSVATEGIVSMFGEDFGAKAEGATTAPLPKELSETRVYVTDANLVERAAPLFFVSPTQINYLIPEGTVPGEAKVVIANKGTVVSTGTVKVTEMAPAFFTANSDGKGAPAAYAVRVKADNSQVSEAVAEFDAVQKKFVPVPISLGTQDEQVILVLFGTGIRYYSSMNNVKATLGGVEAEVQYAGKQGQYVGLDQVNIRVPRSALVAGEVDLVLSVDGMKSNSVRVHIR